MGHFFVSFNIVLLIPLVLFFSTHNVGPHNDLDWVLPSPLSVSASMTLAIHPDSLDTANDLYCLYLYKSSKGFKHFDPSMYTPDQLSERSM